jgi:cytochrome c oxidase cbb3-type subunit I
MEVMQKPYYLMTGLFLMLTALVTLDSSLASIGWTPAVAGLKWMRVHFITLGVLTQLVFGLLPALTARGLNLPRPRMSWLTWLLYNSGLIILLIGLPGINAPMIAAGGTLIFVAVLVLIKDLVNLRRLAINLQSRAVCSTYSTTRFYLGGLVYLLVGVLVGTGMWIGWSEPLRIAIPKEVHVHTNLWGYTALIFAGLIYDLFPDLTRQKLFGRLRLDMLVFGSMALGALGLVTGPWLDLGWPAVAGLTLHTIGTLVLLVQLIRMVVSERKLRQPGMAHMVSAYLWLLVPVVVAPYIVAKASDSFPVAR